MFHISIVLMLYRRDGVVVRAGGSQPGVRDGHSDFCVDLKKKVNPCNFSRDFKIGPRFGPEHVMNSSHVKILQMCENISRYFAVATPNRK